jgi:hypothetical protein
VGGGAKERICTVLSSSGWFTHNRKYYISLKSKLMPMACPFKIIMKSELKLKGISHVMQNKNFISIKNTIKTTNKSDKFLLG